MCRLSLQATWDLIYLWICNYKCLCTQVSTLSRNRFVGLQPHYLFLNTNVLHVLLFLMLMNRVNCLKMTGRKLPCWRCNSNALAPSATRIRPNLSLFISGCSNNNLISTSVATHNHKKRTLRGRCHVCLPKPEHDVRFLWASEHVFISHHSRDHLPLSGA